MAGKKKAENFMKDVTTEKEWESLCDYQVLPYQTKNKHLNHLKCVLKSGFVYTSTIKKVVCTLVM